MSDTTIDTIYQLAEQERAERETRALLTALNAFHGKPHGDWPDYGPRQIEKMRRAVSAFTAGMEK